MRDRASFAGALFICRRKVKCVVMAQRKKRKKFSIIKSVTELEKYINVLPDDVVYKFVSNGGFSSISFIKYVADRAIIRELYASSFRIGRKELQMIDMLHNAGRIGKCHFAVGTLMGRDSQAVRRYKYYDNLVDVCNRNGWEYTAVNNHLKLILMDTDRGKYVIETSSNLNENPKIEQFSFEKDEELYEFYRSVFDLWGDDYG